MPYVTTAQLVDRLDLPIALPSSELKPNNWLVLATFKVQAPMQLTFRYLQLQISDNVLVGLTDTASKLVEPGRGLAYIGIFKNYDGSAPNSNSSLQGTSNDVVFGETSGIFSRITDSPLVITPGTIAESYSFVVVNNTANTNLTVSVNGQIRLDLSAV